MKYLYQVAFDKLYELSKAQPGARVEEHSDEWQGDRENHVNHQVMLSGTWNGRPYLITFQDDPPAPSVASLEIFLAYKNIPGDITIKPKSVFGLVGAFFTGRLVKKLPASLEKHLLVTCARIFRPVAEGFVQDPQVAEALLQFRWSALLSLEVQDGAGFASRHPAQAVQLLNQPWLEQQLSLLGHLALSG